MTRRDLPQRVLKAMLVIAAAGIFTISCLQQSRKEPVTLTSSDPTAPIPAKALNTTFREFAHDVPEHKQFECASCHRREGSSMKMELASHESCIGCHFNQFVDKEQMLCTICHQETRSADPPVKPFPAVFKEGFDMRFDHGAHDSGKGRPPGGCTSCHNPAGPGMTIPVGFKAHADCYSCHTAETKIGSCGTCHQLAPYDRTRPSEYPLGTIFRHGDHGPRQGIGCTDCHTVVNGAPRSRQVRNISISEHRGPGNNCANCHNGRRAFTGNNPFDVNSCSRCHRGPGFGVLPRDTVPD